MSFEVGRLTENLDIHPRACIDARYLSQLIEAVKAGASIPPVVVDKRTHTIIDGVYRVRAVRAVGGEHARIGCEVRPYRNTLEMFLDAVKRNSAHGLRLTDRDRRVVVEKARAFGVDDIAVVAKALSITTETCRELTIDARRVAKSIDPARPRTVQPAFVRRRLDPVPCINAIIEAVESQDIDLEDKRLMSRLRHLASMLEAITVG